MEEDPQQKGQKGGLDDKREDLLPQGAGSDVALGGDVGPIAPPT